MKSLTPAQLSRRALALSGRRPDLVRRRVLGFTEGERPVETLRVRSEAASPRRAVILAGGHPDEDTRHTMAQLVAFLAGPAGAPLRAGWEVHVVLDCDPDGSALNAGRRSERLARYFAPSTSLRRRGDEQPVWQYPLVGVGEPSGPGTDSKAASAVRGLVDEVRPDVLIDLHRSVVDGLYVLMTDPGAAALPDGLEKWLPVIAARYGVPLALDGAATADRISTPPLGRGGLFEATHPADVLGTWQGAPWHYVRERGGRGFVVEVPQFLVREATWTRGEAARWLRRTAERITRHADWIDDLAGTEAGRAFADWQPGLLEHADLLAAPGREHETAQGHFAHTIAVRVSGAFARHMLERHPADAGPALRLHAALVADMQRATQARALAPDTAADIALAVIGVILDGGFGLGAAWARCAGAEHGGAW
ncbi:hypothetical protein [Streptomyces sp. NPDC088925]|uniref:hypothetical protein n=1 Tax=Streptomyces sp. NPDC088925 TaxID=3365914 RepID=UPI003800A59B